MLSRKFLRAIAVIVVPVLVGFGPCGPLPGGLLEGPVVFEKVNDFSFVNDVEHCALEVIGDEPHSVTVNCWTVGKQLFIGCTECSDKQWSDMIVKNTSARVKIGDRLYPILATKMQDEGAIERAWRFRWLKYEDGDAEPVPDDYWLFHMRSLGKG